MKRTLMGGLLAAATLLGGLALTGGTVTATDTPENEPVVCYDQTPFQEWKFKKTVTTPAVEEVSHVEYRWDIQTREAKSKTKYQYQKQTRSRAAYSENWSDWTWWSPPSYKTSFNNVEVLESGDHDGQADWFWNSDRDYRYVKNGVTESIPDGYTDWAAAGSTDWSTSDAKPADTDTTRYVNKQSKTVIDVEYAPAFDTTFFYNGGAVSEVDENIYGTNNDLDRSWTKFGERTNPGEPFEVDCPTQDPKVDKSYTEWKDGEFDCDDTTVEQTRVKTVTTTVYTWNGDGFDEEVSVTTETQTRTRDLTDEEIEPCPTTPPTTAPPTTEPPVTTAPPVTTVPAPTTAPPVTPAPTPAPTPPAPVAPTGGLPATGSPLTGLFAAIAGLLMLAGVGGVTLAARRR